MASPSAIKSTQDDMINELIMEKLGNTKSPKTEKNAKGKIIFLDEESQQKDSKKSNVDAFK